MDNPRRDNRPQPKNRIDDFYRGNNFTPPRTVSGGNVFKNPLAANTKNIDGFTPTRSAPIGDRPRQRPDISHIQAQSTQQLTRRPALHRSVRLENKQAKKSLRQRIPKIMKRTAIFSTLTVVLIGGFLFTKGYLKFRDVFKGGGFGALALKKNIDPVQLKGEGDGRVNILMLGRGGPGHEGEDLTDTILVASIDPIQKSAALLSIPRDLYIKPETGGGTKINAVYSQAKQRAEATGGNDETIQKEAAGAVTSELNKVLGIPLHYYVLVDFKAFQDGINAVNGITLDVKEPLYERMSYQGKPYILDVKTGLQQFDGLRALMYSRSRYTSKRGDFDRAERQRAVLLGLKDRVLSAGTFTDPVKLSKLIDAFGDHVQTDLGQSEIKRVYEIGKDIDSSQIASLSLVDPPQDYLTTGNIGGLSVVIPKAGQGNYKDIHSFVRNELKDSFIRQEDAKIVILNGTAISGIATKKAEELRSYGYTVTVVDSAPTDDYDQTVLVDLKLSDKKYTRRYLEQRLGVSATSTLPDSTINRPGADFVIILGSSEANTQL